MKGHSYSSRCRDQVKRGWPWKIPDVCSYPHAHKTQHNKTNTSILHLQSLFPLNYSSQQPVRAGLEHGYNLHFITRLSGEGLATNHMLKGVAGLGSDFILESHSRVPASTQSAVNLAKPSKHDMTERGPGWFPLRNQYTASTQATLLSIGTSCAGLSRPARSLHETSPH